MERAFEKFFAVNRILNNPLRHSQYTKTNKISLLDLNKWANVQSITKITYTTDTVTEDRYFNIYTSLRRRAVKIENNLHWVLDVVFREDESRIRDERTALNFAWFRKMSISLLTKDDTNMSMKRKMLRNWAQPENIIKGLGI